ncbi:hypothetical protein KAR91_53755 [Candidatus Pacearchaeota archaeon]|nr:hypothetical protein [Candidatus Pacearchaeota archaeon]
MDKTAERAIKEVGNVNRKLGYLIGAVETARTELSIYGDALRTTGGSKADEILQKALKKMKEEGNDK